MKLLCPQSPSLELQQPSGWCADLAPGQLEQRICPPSCQSPGVAVLGGTAITTMQIALPSPHQRGDAKANKLELELPRETISLPINAFPAPILQRAAAGQLIGALPQQACAMVGDKVAEQLSIRMFVYGTLMRNQLNHTNYLTGAHFLGESATAPCYQLRDLIFCPGMLANGDQTVHGELYLVNSKLLAKIDMLEGHPVFYKRSLIQLADGQTALGYLLPPTPDYLNATLISPANWRLWGQH